ncbi:hypothetical protein OJ253_1944 [Cryptosporidium canis]|uniref:Uncharacterized protein n=1 Tax=Cryptosporidium canis TaxID=195482 RepID=A0A9D5DH31_9CRYT|nr:hypothetical protein OJ253_1944 [Cryptosporidium canis]
MSIEEYADWYSFENLEGGAINFNELKDESGWYNIEINNHNGLDSNDTGASESVTWSLSINFRSITLQDPATLIFKAPNWYRIIKGRDEISPSKCPKTNPPYPCRRSTTVFSDHEIEISSRLVCSWRDIFDKLSSEPLEIESYKVSAFGDQEIHSRGYINLKHILIQAEKSNPTSSRAYIFGSDTYRIWPTRILLYPGSGSGASNAQETSTNELNPSSGPSSDSDPSSHRDDKRNSIGEEEKDEPIGLVEVEVVLQDCKRRPISDNSPRSGQRVSNAKTDYASVGSGPRPVSGSRSRSRSASRSSPAGSPKNDRSSNSSWRIRGRSKTPPPKRVSFSPPKPENSSKDYEFGLDDGCFSPEDLEFLRMRNVYDGFDSFSRSPGGLSDFSSNMGYFTAGDVEFSNKLIETIVKEIDPDELDEPDVDADDYASNIGLELWKKSEKERFIKHLHNLEEEFRKLTLLRQETIMREFIGDINRKSSKLGRLENLVSNKILKLKNKENSIDNVNDENNRRMKLFQFEQKKLLESQRNEFQVKLELEKKKTQIVEFEKNKWLKKYHEEEETNAKLQKELQSLKTGRKSDLYFKSELTRKDELIQSLEGQISQLKEGVQLLKASRDHYKTQFEHLAAAVQLIPEKEPQPVVPSKNNVYSHNIDSLVQSGLYSEEDQFIQLLRSNNTLSASVDDQGASKNNSH